MLPETQRTALMLREMDGLSYDQIADVMETTVPSVKSLLVRARVALAEMSEARDLTCEDVRIELGEVAEGLTRRLTPPVKRHLKSCDRCKEFKSRLTASDVAVAAMAPVGLLVALKNLVVGQLGLGSGSATAGSAVGATAGSSAAGAAGGLGGAISAGAGAVASKAAAGLAAAALVTTGVVQVDKTVTQATPATAAIEADAPARAVDHHRVATAKVAAATPTAVAASASVTPAAVAEPATVALDSAPAPAEAAPAPEATAPAPTDANTGSTVVIDESIDLPPTDTNSAGDNAGSGQAASTSDNPAVTGGDSEGTSVAEASTSASPAAQ